MRRRTVSRRMVLKTISISSLFLVPLPTYGSPQLGQRRTGKCLRSIRGGRSPRPRADEGPCTAPTPALRGQTAHGPRSPPACDAGRETRARLPMSAARVQERVFLPRYVG